MTKIKFQTSDGEIHEVPVKIAKCLPKIAAIIDMLGTDNMEHDAIQLPDIKSPIFKKVIAWVIHHNDDQPPAEDDDSDEEEPAAVDSWDANFLEADLGTVLEILAAAEYFGIKDLLGLTCTDVADIITGKTPEDIRELFHIVNDFTPSEDQSLYSENDWCEEI